MFSGLCNFFSGSGLGYVFIILMTVMASSSFIVFSNENEPNQINWLNELLGPILVVFSGKHLNKTGRKARPFFLISTALFLIFLFFDVSDLAICN